MGIDSGKGILTGERVARGDLGSRSGKPPERTGAWLLKMHLLSAMDKHLKMQVYCSSQVGDGGVWDVVRLLERQDYCFCNF